MPAMSKHHFDHTVDHSDDTKAERQPERLQRIEVITGIGGRRQWSTGDQGEHPAGEFRAWGCGLRGGATSRAVAAAVVRVAAESTQDDGGSRR